MPKIIIRSQNRQVGEHALKPGFTSIGRLPSNDICVENLGVSRLHAFILGDKRGEVFVLEDLGSLNGTFVNKKRVQKWLLRANDTIALGQHQLEFLVPESPTAEPFSRTTGLEPYLLATLGGNRIPLLKDITYFGNSSADDVHIPGLMVGRHFASIDRKGTAFYVNMLVPRFQQLRVNGGEVRSAPLEDGDRLEVGGVEFTFHLP